MLWFKKDDLMSSRPTIGVHKLIVKSQRWKKTALAAAAAALFGLIGSSALALSLGRITVQSALGEPLRAEIDVADINAEETASLKATIASPEAFRAAGLDYNPAMAGLLATLQRRADGRAYIRLSSERAINEPFVDMILEANWASGRIVRDYTMLFDPPSMRQATPAVPSPAQIPAQSPIVKPATPAKAVAPASGLAPQAAEPSKSTGKVPARPVAVKAASAGAGTSQVIVKTGDTASKIANSVKPPSVSLDQMLVAMLRANPAAFRDSNINRIKAGAAMTIPSEEQAAATPAGEAAQIIVAQSKDFNDFRRKLASSAPTTQIAAGDRKSSGSVQTRVEDKKPGTVAPDKLTLSKGSIQAKPAEDLIAKERSAKEAASRAAEITKNISDLSKLGAVTSAAGSAMPASAASAAKPGPALIATTTPVAATPAASATVTTSPPPAQAASAAASAPIAPASRAASEPKAAASAQAKRPLVAPVRPPEPGLIDSLIENPLVPAGAVSLIAVLAGFGLYRSRQRKQAARGNDSSFLESRLQPDSFFGASGGQSVDTSDSAVTGSSLMYSPSQLDAADDVDPVAEADVYLAYGRDLQAEEILKEALNVTPGRLAVHQKLLEIFAKRRDTQSFEEIARLASKVTEARGSEWERICETGLSIDPANPLYLGNDFTGDTTASQATSTALDFSLDADENTGASAATPEDLQSGAAMDLDLDLDFSLDETPASIISETSASNAATAPSVVDMDFGLMTEAVEAPHAVAAAEVQDAADDVDFTLPDLEFGTAELPSASTEIDDFKAQATTSFGLTAPAPLPVPEPAPPPPPDLGMLEFDLGSLSLDLDEAPEAPAIAEESPPEDPLATKLALAEEFSAIGDDDGARALIEEVISEASGDMKIKAQRALSNL